MPRIPPRIVLAAGILVTSTNLFMGGCADNESMLFVRGVIAWPNSGDCTITADASQLMRLGGVLDLAFRTDYVAPLLVGNQLTRRGSRDQIRTESSRVSLRGSIVEISDPQGNKLTEYTTDGTGFVDPADGDNPGYGIVSSTLIPGGLFNAGGPFAGITNVIVNVRVFGNTLGGEDVESNKLTYPIAICTGCTVSFPTKAIDLGTNECISQEDPQAALPCAVGLDDPIDCRYCYSRNPYCVSPPPPQ